MSEKDKMRPLAPNPQKGLFSSEHVASGIPIPKTRRIELFSPDEWEEFTEEWASILEDSYHQVSRFGGAGDQGLDVVGFISDGTFDGGWDNYQCKHYDGPLAPSDVWLEIGKLIYYTFSGEYPPPQNYYFVASKGIGTSLGKLLANPARLKEKARENWPKYCAGNISKSVTADLTGELLDHFNDFDFSIFKSKSLADLIKGHFKTPFHTVRFGGGLPARPISEPPPGKITVLESRYIEQIFEAYSDRLGAKIKKLEDVEKHPGLEKDFLRQRERFYHAESLRNFARDTVPTGTFEELQEEVFQGVIDTCDSEHEDGFVRMQVTMTQSARLPVTSSPLCSVTKTQDKQGICHQLANGDRLVWVQKNEE